MNWPGAREGRHYISLDTTIHVRSPLEGCNLTHKRLAFERKIEYAFNR